MIDPPAPDSAFRSDPGRIRSNNEDAVGRFEPADPALRAERGCLYVVADGMGGHAAGEVASNYAVASILRDYFMQPWEGAEPALRAAIAAANAAIHEEGTAPGGRQGMGCTVVAAALLGERAVIINVGDSRAYLLREGQLRQVSLDHSWVAERVAIGLLTPEEAAAHLGKNVLTRNLGFSPETEPSVADLALQDGDRLLLCSDGLSGPLTEDRIAALLGEGSAEQAVTALIAAANEAGGPDNIGVAVIAVGAERAQPPQDVVEALAAPAWLSTEEAPEAAQPIPAEPPVVAASTAQPRGWELVGVMSAAAAPVAAPAAGEEDRPDHESPAAAEAPVSPAAEPAAWQPFTAPSLAAATPAQMAAPQPKRRPLLLGAVAAAVLVGVLAVGGFALAGRGGSSHKTAAIVAATTTAQVAAPLAAATASTTPTPAGVASPTATAGPLLSALATAPAASPTPTTTPAPTSGPAGPGNGPDTLGEPPGPTVAARPGSTSASGGGGTAGRTIAPTPPVLFQVRPGDTLESLWQSCYTELFPTFSVFAEAAAVLNASGVDLNDLKPGDRFVLPGGWTGATCPLSGAQPLPAATAPRRVPF